MYIINKFIKTHKLSLAEYHHLLTLQEDEAARALLREEAFRLRTLHFGNTVYVRGLIEFTNICKNDCLYCGIRKSNKTVARYRLSKENILSCCEQGHALGFRTFVLQGGEDPYLTDAVLTDIISEIKQRYPDCALTLSVGERSFESYKALRQAGADRYLLRHETADQTHYESLHPEELSFDNRRRCLRDLKQLGFQTGAGFMVGSPGQTLAHLAEDLIFLQDLAPEMIGIGPFIPHHETPFADATAGSVDMTLYLLAVLRIMHPKVLLPATTALGTLSPTGREQAMGWGANVVMPNLSPVENRKQYDLYDNKICTGEEAAECRSCLAQRMERAGFRIVTDRGDYQV